MVQQRTDWAYERIQLAATHTDFALLLPGSGTFLPHLVFVITTSQLTSNEATPQTDKLGEIGN